MKSVAIYCGSSNGAQAIYREEAIRLGQEIAARQLTLVYGGASVGMMGAIADAALAAGGKVVGIIPAFLDKREIAHKSLSELIVVDTMHERKARMVELADGFIALPGGPGTLEEFFEVFTWAQIGLHQKPIGIYNIQGYYNPLVSLLNHMADEQFLHEKYRSLAIVNQDPIALLDDMGSFTPPELKSYDR